MWVGETARSSYERSCEHVRDLKGLEDKSHLLKHYILVHRNEIKLEDMEYGVRVRSRHKTALERQVGEAVAIHREKEKGIQLLNSKSEYNRCKIHRLETRQEKRDWIENLIEAENDLKIQSALIELKSSKRSRPKEKIAKEKVSLKNVCIEIGNENILEWRKRRKIQVEEKEKREKVEEESYERIKRLNLRDFVKKKKVRELKRKGVIEREKLSENEIKVRKSYWRDYREKTVSNNSTLVPLENSRDKEKESPEKSISEIGNKIKLRLKEPRLKRESFKDLSVSEYMRLRPTRNETAIADCSDYMASYNAKIGENKTETESELVLLADSETKSLEARTTQVISNQVETETRKEQVLKENLSPETRNVEIEVKSGVSEINLSEIETENEVENIIKPCSETRIETEVKTKDKTSTESLEVQVEILDQVDLKTESETLVTGIDIVET